MTIESLRTIAILVAKAYEEGALSFSPGMLWGDQVKQYPRVQLRASVFEEMFQDSALANVRKDNRPGYEYQVTINGVMFFCLSDEPIECFEPQPSGR